MLRIHTNAARSLAGSIAMLLVILGISAAFPKAAEAAVATVTLRLGATEEYGSTYTYVRWITHINGDPVDLDEIPGTKRSYAYCVQPSLPTPASGEYAVSVIDDDNTGRSEKMRKMIYYLPGAYGYTRVTRKRWFDIVPSGTSAYTLGHIALSYIYDNCSGDGDAWKGCSELIKNKVKYMVSDLDDLKEPPEDFEVFWIRVEGHQDTFGAIYKTEYGKACVRKTSENTDITDNNECYKLGGAKFGLYEDQSCSRRASDRNGKAATLITGDSGESEAVEIETGDYYLKEISAPKGYAVNEKVIPVNVALDKTTVVRIGDVPQSDPVDILICKVDAETGIAKAQGAATLEAAEFTVKYYDVTAPAESADDTLLNKVRNREPLRTWIFETDEKGEIYLDEKYLIEEKSDELYRNNAGSTVVPLGIVTIEETRAPVGYCRDREIHALAVTAEGSGETLETLQPLIEDNAVREQVKRGNLSFTKSADGRERMAGVIFRITSETTGESHDFKTDENGYADTSADWTGHEDGHIDEDNMSGVWFNGYNDRETGAKPNTTLGALPYDRYLIEELPCEANAGYRLFSDTVTISRHDRTVNLGTYDNEPEDPGKPDDPKDPKNTQPDKPKDPGDDELSDKTEIVTPETGDSFLKIYIYSMAAVTTLCGVILLTVIRKGGRLKNRKNM